MKVRPRQVFKLLLYFLGIYLFTLFTFYLFHDRLIFRRTQLPLTHTFQFTLPYEEYFITTPDQTRLNALYFKTEQESKGLIFYLHGNADNLSRWGSYAVDFTSKGYDVFMLDYRGYGKSEGKPTESLLYQDAAFTLNWVFTNLPHTRLIIYGRSLGSAVASQLAGKVEPELLILETPFAEIKDVVYWLLRPAFYLFPMDIHFSNTQSLPKVHCRKAIFHGTRDWIVPLASAESLTTSLGPADHFIVIEGGGHRNLRDFPLYHEKLAEILPQDPD